MMYTIAISFADEQKELAETLAAFCKVQELSCYYYIEEFGRTSGLPLKKELQRIYRNDACLSIVLLSAAYFEREHTRIEWKAICERAKDYESGMMMILADEQSAIPALKWGYTPWKGNQYSILSEIVKRAKKCSEEGKKKSTGHPEEMPSIKNTFKGNDISGGVTINN